MPNFAGRRKRIESNLFGRRFFELANDWQTKARDNIFKSRLKVINIKFLNLLETKSDNELFFVNLSHTKECQKAVAFFFYIREF